MKRRSRPHASIDCLAALTAKDKELKKSRAETLEVKLQQETTPTEGLSCRKVEAVNRGHTSLNEQVHQLKSEQMKLEEDVRHKDEWIQTETKKRRASTESYLAGQAEWDGERAGECCEEVEEKSGAAGESEGEERRQTSEPADKWLHKEKRDEGTFVLKPLTLLTSSFRVISWQQELTCHLHQVLFPSRFTHANLCL